MGVAVAPESISVSECLDDLARHVAQLEHDGLPGVLLVVALLLLAAGLPEGGDAFAPHPHNPLLPVMHHRVSELDALLPAQLASRAYTEAN